MAVDAKTFFEKQDQKFSEDLETYEIKIDEMLNTGKYTSNVGNSVILYISIPAAFHQALKDKYAETGWFLSFETGSQREEPFLLMTRANPALMHAAIMDGRFAYRLNK